MAKTAIEWADFTMNFWTGCTKVENAPACDHCYAEQWSKRSGHVEWGGDRRRTSHDNWMSPYKWDRRAKREGIVQTVFSLSLGDFWDNHETIGDFWRREAVEVMRNTPNLIWLILSKRIGNAVKMCHRERLDLPRNVALGATMVTQKEWDRDMPKLKEAARVLEPAFTFASVEPMMEPINMIGELPGLVICVGESGAHARLMAPEWARSLRDQCRVAGVPFFLKQMTSKGLIPNDLMVRDKPDMIAA